MIEELYNHQTNLEKIIDKRTFELKEMNTKLQSLDILKNDFIANITHDFRSPLMVILNLAHLALRHDYSKEKIISNPLFHALLP